MAPPHLPSLLTVEVGVGAGFGGEVALFVAVGDVTRVVTDESTGWTTEVPVDGGATVWSAVALVVATKLVDFANARRRIASSTAVISRVTAVTVLRAALGLDTVVYKADAGVTRCAAAGASRGSLQRS